MEYGADRFPIIFNKIIGVEKQAWNFPGFLLVLVVIHTVLTKDTVCKNIILNQTVWNSHVFDQSHVAGINLLLHKLYIYRTVLSFWVVEFMLRSRLSMASTFIDVANTDREICMVSTFRSSIVVILYSFSLWDSAGCSRMFLAKSQAWRLQRAWWILSGIFPVFLMSGSRWVMNFREMYLKV